MKPLSIPFNVAVLHIASKLLPRGFDVSADAPQDYDSLVSHYERTGRVLVWNGASDKTIFASSEVSFAFRAWLASKHITGGFPFTEEGEIAALNAQMADVYALYDGETAEYFCQILYAEILGQSDYAAVNGGFPVDQAGFVCAYLLNPDSALRGDFGVSPTAA